MKKYSLIISIIFIFNLGEMSAKDKDYAFVYGQSPIVKMPPKLEKGRDPFSLPPGVKLLGPMGEEKQVKREEIREDLNKSAIAESISSQQPKPADSPLVLRAILISDRIRLAAIEERLVTEGAVIGEEKVLEIKPDRVILGRGQKKRTLYLPQSSISLIVDER